MIVNATFSFFVPALLCMSILTLLIVWVVKRWTLGKNKPFSKPSGNMTPFLINYLMKWWWTDFEGMVLCLESIDFCNCYMIKIIIWVFGLVMIFYGAHVCVQIWNHQIWDMFQIFSLVIFAHVKAFSVKRTQLGNMVFISHRYPRWLEKCATSMKDAGVLRLEVMTDTESWPNGLFGKHRYTTSLDNY